MKKLTPTQRKAVYRRLNPYMTRISFDLGRESADALQAAFQCIAGSDCASEWEGVVILVALQDRCRDVEQMRKREAAKEAEAPS